MRITNYQTFIVGTPWRNLTYVLVETDAGITGVGEARVVGKTHTVAQYLLDVRRHIVGHDPHDIEALYRRLTLLDVIRLFEDFEPASTRREPGEATPVGMALRLVQSEIDEMAKATFGSITLATMLRLTERQATPAKAAAARRRGR